MRKKNRLTQETLEIRFPQLKHGALTVLKNPSRFKHIAAGRRWRKTTLAACKAVYCATRKNQDIFWGSSTYDQVSIGYREACRMLAQPISIGAVEAVQNRELRIGWNKKKIMFRSLDDPDNARGHTADGVIIDEAQLIDPKAWYEVIRPFVSDRNGWAEFYGTPKGKNWWYYLRQEGLQDPEFSVWQIPTLGAEIHNGTLVRAPHPLENEDFSWKELNHLYKTLPEMVFRQEWLAEFLEDVGSVFRNVVLSAKAKYQDGPKSGHRYAMGIDLAKYNDFTVIKIIDIDLMEECYCDRFNQVDYTLQRSRIKHVYELFQPDICIGDGTSVGIPVIEDLQRDGVPIESYVSTSSSKKELIEALSIGIEQNMLKILPDIVTISELQSFSTTRLPGGGLRYEAPNRMTDDCVIALALAWFKVYKDHIDVDAQPVTVDDYAEIKELKL